MQVTFTAPLVVWSGKAAWHFLILPPDDAGMIRMALGARAGLRRAGFGAVKVKVQIGASQWSTSIFPHGAGYLLPVKAQIRQREGLAAGEACRVTLFVDA